MKKLFIFLPLFFVTLQLQASNTSNKEYSVTVKSNVYMQSTILAEAYQKANEVCKPMGKRPVQDPLKSVVTNNGPFIRAVMVFRCE